MNIGQASAASGISAKMIRYYESIGLIGKPRRSGGNYRVYSEDDIHTLRFIRRARGLGFSVARTAQLLELWHNSQRASGDVKKLAMQQIAELDQKIAEMQAMRRTLGHLAECCSGDNRPNCPILDDISELAKPCESHAHDGHKTTPAGAPTH